MENLILTIAAELMDDLDISPSPMLRIRREGSSEWEFMSDKIHGFVHEAGVEAKIEVSVTPVEAPVPGASSLRYDLVRMISTENH